MKMRMLLILLLPMIVQLSYGQISGKANPRSADKNAFGDIDEEIGNFKGTIYYLPANTTRLPDFSTLEPKGEIFSKSLNVSQKFRNGFPGITNRFENFAIDYKGQFYLKDSCTIAFLLGSDDGSKLFIDNKLVIDNDLLHALAFKSSTVSLAKGTHNIEVQYFQGPREDVALILKYKKVADTKFAIFNLADFSPISVSEQKNSISVSIGNEVLFDSDSHHLSDEAKLALREVKRLILDKMEIKQIIIEGHTDDIGTDAYNMKLSTKRANAVKQFFSDMDISPKVMTAIGAGESKPKHPNLNNESRRENRRIELSIEKIE